MAGTSEPFSIAAASFKITRRAAPHSSLPNSVRQGVSVASISIPKCGVFVQTIRMANFCGSRFRFSRPPCWSACVTAYQQPPMKVYTWKATNQNYTPAAPGHCCDATPPPQFSLLHTRRRLLARWKEGGTLSAGRPSDARGHVSTRVQGEDGKRRREVVRWFNMRTWRAR